MKKSKEGRCQCCNNTLTENSHLVFGDEGRNINIATLLFNYIKKALNENDGLKYAVCDPCWQQLIQYNEFQQKCIRANQVASEEEEVEETVDNEAVENCNDNEMKEGDDEMVVNGKMIQEVESYSEHGDESQHNSNFEEYQQYEYDEDLDDMQIEYLDENDMVDDENWCDNQDTNTVRLPNDAHKKLPFDFTSVLVKPIFMLGIGTISFSSDFSFLS